MKKLLFLISFLFTITVLSQDDDPAPFVDGVSAPHYDPLRTYTNAELTAMTNVPTGRKAYSSDDNAWKYYDGSTWQTIGSGGGSQNLQQVLDTGNTSTTDLLLSGANLEFPTLGTILSGSGSYFQLLSNVLDNGASVGIHMTHQHTNNEGISVMGIGNTGFYFGSETNSSPLKRAEFRTANLNNISYFQMPAIGDDIERVLPASVNGNYAGNDGDITVPTGVSDIVEDTTPQLGGNLDAQNNSITNANNITSNQYTLTSSIPLGAPWDGDLTVPTKDAVYDAINGLPSGFDPQTNISTVQGANGVEANEFVTKQQLDLKEDTSNLGDLAYQNVADLNIPSTINTAPIELTPAPSHSVVHTPLQPNRAADVTENTSFTVTGTSVGHSGRYEIDPTGTEQITFNNSDGGTLVINAVGGAPINAHFIHTYKHGVVWYVNDDTFTLPNDTQAPTAPTSLAASNPNETTMDLTWVAGTDNVAVTNYDVYVDAVLHQANVGNVTSYTVTGLTESTEYDFTVRAKDAAGNVSTDSNTATESTIASTETPIYGTLIESNGGGTISGSEGDKAFDGNINTFWYPFGSQFSRIGQDFTTAKNIYKVRLLPRQDAGNADKLNDCQVQWSTDNSTWNNIGSPVSGVTSGNFTNWVEITFTAQSARYWRIENPTSGTYGGQPAEIEFYEQ